MSKSDWKLPFLRLRDQIRPSFNSRVKLYHGILMAPFHEGKDLKDVVENLDPCDRGKVKVAVIETPTEGCQFHAHYFFGDSGGCKLLGHALSGIDDWMRAVPKELLPRFNVPCDGMYEPFRNLVTWANLVYYLAWEIDAPYLQAAVEHQARVEEVGFFPWSEWPQPAGCDPRPLLIHQGDNSGQFEKMLRRFGESEEFQWCPDIIDAYLVGEEISGEFIAASLSAIDILVFMLDQVRGDEAVKQNELTTPIRRKSTKRSRIANDIMLLKAFLRVYHDPNVNMKTAQEPLTAEQIAELMGWVNKAGEPVQSRASRRMSNIFGPDAMNKYRALFEGNLKKGFWKILGDATRDLDAIASSDDHDSEENDWE
jgi:hypothetical protein